MKMVELFRRLAYGELSNLSINAGDGKLVDEKHPQIVQYVNAGLLALHSRFLLRERNLIVEQTSHVINYHLLPKFAQSADSGDVRHRYIIDCEDSPFQGDLIKILSVYDESGRQLPLNDKNNPDSLFTPRPDTLQIGSPVDGARLAILYQARHPKLDDRIGKILDQEIDIPFFLENALQNFVGHQTFSHMNGSDNIIKGQEYLAAYEATCTDIEQRDLANQSFHTSHHKLEQRGFV